MAVKIRLRQQGRNNRQSFRIVAIDIRNKRDGKYIEKLGWYDPFLVEKNTEVNAERIAYWLDKGAEISHDAAKLIMKSSPHVMKQWNEKKLAQKQKRAQKRRALRREKRAQLAGKK